MNPNEILEKILVKYRKSVPVAAQQGVIPYQGRGSAWIPAPFEGTAWWTNGFWPAIMWQLHSVSPEALFAGEARRAQALLLSELRDHVRLHHDVGFMYLLSFGAEHRVTTNEAAKEPVLIAADVLAGRFNPNGFIRAWNGAGREGWAIIDCLMNLPLLLWATEQTGDPRYELIARLHADTSIREFVREDGSCDHIVIFDPRTGAVLDRPGGQGYAPGSSWSRGQAWALYGFTLMAKNTGEPRYLDAARKIAAYFIQNIRADGLTDCDFRQPGGEERIDNIAGACAACALLLLSELTEAAAYREAAMRLLEGLCAHCVDLSADHFGILTKCTASYHDDGAGRHVNIVYGDYFFIEAMTRLCGADPMLWDAKVRNGA